MDPEFKTLLRTIVRRVHPDLFASNPRERETNSESLKLLNSYLESLSAGELCTESRLEFWAPNEASQSLIKVTAVLPAWGSLGPLFYAFDLINEEQLLAGFGACKSGAAETDFLSWLNLSVEQANQAASQHEALKLEIKALREKLEDKLSLRSVQVGGDVSVSIAEQRRQIQALEIAHSALEEVKADGGKVEGLALKIYHPSSDAAQKLRVLDPELSASLTGPAQGCVGDDGTVHLMAEAGRAGSALQGLDLERARLLAQVTTFWDRRARDLAAALRDVLGVQKVWYDASTELGHQKFVTWAGNLLTNRSNLSKALENAAFNFSLLAHCDESAPSLEFMPATSVLQVRMDTEASQLAAFMKGSLAQEASHSAAGVAAAKAEEEELLERVKEALGLRHVIRVCSSSHQARVMEAARRLLANAHQIRQSGINLQGACLAIDDCYEVWESGFISIPFDFRLQDLQPKLQRLLASTPPTPSTSQGSEPLAEAAPDPPSVAPTATSPPPTGSVGARQAVHSRHRSRRQQWREFSSGSGMEQSSGADSWVVRGRGGVSQGRLRRSGAKVEWQQSRRPSGSTGWPPNPGSQQSTIRSCLGGSRATHQTCHVKLRF